MKPIPTLRWIGMVVWLVLPCKAFGQEDDSLSIQKKWSINGYLKDLQSLTFDKNLDSLVTGNLLHNRINIRWRPTERLTAGADFRTRLFWGEEVRLNPEFSSSIDNAYETVDLSILWFETESMVMQTNMDRFWLEYAANNWDVRIGRQRINWGISTLWNPNDIFNTYNFLDFDYEERPGRDALKFRYQLSGMSNVELALAGADDFTRAVGAVKYFTNRWDYDFQFSAGVYQKIITLGTGWSGCIQDAGFKGELQYYAKHDTAVAQLNATVEIDYMFKNSWYGNAGLLVNSNGINEPINDRGLLNFQLSPQNLMPTQWNTAVTVGKELSPLLAANITWIYAPGTNLLLVLPSLTYNLASNLDFSLIWQSFFAEQNQDFESILHRGYIRIKWSF